MAENYYEVRKSKLENWKVKQGVKYLDKFDKKFSCLEAKELPDGHIDVAIAGRIMAIRDMGKLSFGHLMDYSGKVQFMFKVQTLEQETYKFLLKNLDVGDYVGLTGKMFTTQKGEKTLDVSECKLLSKSLRALPEKWHGVNDPEIKARQRYLDLIMNEDTRQRFKTRNLILKGIRNYLESNGFTEVDTPILQVASSGASARPFITHHNALDIPLYLRIAPETYLKRLMVGGYERIFEMGKSFRNEGIDSSHLQEFTMLEYYAAYWNYRDNMKFIQEMIKELVLKACGTLKIEYQGTVIDFSGDWEEVEYRDLVLKDTGIDLDKINSIDDLKIEIRAKELKIDVDKYVGLGALIDALYKKFSRPKLIQPMFLTMHHKSIVPLARCSDDNGDKLDMFQVLVNSWEVVKAYSELIDPEDQRQRLMEQQALSDAGDDEAMMLEEDFILSMEYGMPPMSGLGLGVDRIITLLTDTSNIRDIIYFPSLRPMTSKEVDIIENEKVV
jgi:lysyl-tRNA synthetase class 2